MLRQPLPSKGNRCIFKKKKGKIVFLLSNVTDLQRLSNTEALPQKKFKGGFRHGFTSNFEVLLTSKVRIG